MIYRVLGFVSIASLLITASGCARLCQHADQQINQPIQRTETFLRTYPDPKAILAECPALLKDLQNLPEGAQTIRALADQHFGQSSNCSSVVHTPGYAFTCSSSSLNFPATPGSFPVYGNAADPVCGFIPQSSEYCESYNFDFQAPPEYANAIDLSRNLDVLNAKIQKMCTDASAGNNSNAVMESADALSFIDKTITPEGNAAMNDACGS